MTTDDRVMAILERANPVPPGELVDVPDGATRYLETVLMQRSEPMTIVDPTPTRTTDQPPRRRWPLIAVAASVVALVVASIALVVATRDDAAVVDEPAPTVPPTPSDATTPEAAEPPTTVAAPDPAAARATVDEFFQAYNSGATDDVLAMVTTDAVVTEQYGTGRPDPADEGWTRDDLVNGFAWNHAQGEIWTDPQCTLAGQQLPAGATLSCQWDTLDAVIQAVDGEPIPTNALIVVSDGMIVELHRAFTRPDFATLGTPFRLWMESSHPDVEGADCCSGDTREDSERRGALRAEWAQEWDAWLDVWGCESTSCTIPAEQWVAEYDAQCVSLDPAGMPTHDSVATVRLLPPTRDQLSSTRERLLDLDDGLIDPDVSDELAAELQTLRLDAMIELGIDERCHPVVE
ncbi:hypothetical protein [Ilumatobacter sp.]|uniref:hypothetical protein n=1 Tax=Ilumatobacter sp. TaxID=1967498 RepID=UPI003AF78D4B